MTYAIRYRQQYYRDANGNPQGDERWLLPLADDHHNTKEDAELSHCGPVELSHGAYGCDVEAVTVGGRDYRRAYRNTFGMDP